MSELPNCWAKARLEELTVFVLGGDWGKAPEEQLEESDLARCIRASELRNWDSEKGKTAALRRLTVSSLEKRTLAVDDLLVEISGGGPEQPVGRVVRISKQVLAQNSEHPKVCTNFFRMVRLAAVLNASFIEFYLQHFYTIGGVRPLQAGSNNLRNLKFPDYLDQSVPIAPLNEQHRIVEKIEILFAELDKGEESLRAAKARAGLYRQSLLKHAFEGHLTADWRAANPDKLEDPKTLLVRIQTERDARFKQGLAEWEEALAKWREEGEGGKRPSKPRRHSSPDNPTAQQRENMWALPPSWQWLQIGNFAFVTKLAGFEYTKHVIYKEDGDLPVLKAENAGPLGFKKTNYSLVKRSDVEMLTRSLLFGGELLMTFVGAGTGQVATVPSDQEYFLGPNIGMMRILHDGIHPKYIEHFLRSPVGSALKMAAVKAVAQPSLSMGTIRQVPVALPSPAEQVEIVNRLDTKLSTLDALDAQLDAQLARSRALRQSILKRAFSGQLVPQDPSDELASKLLERIKAKKAAMAQKAKADGPKRRRRKPKPRRPTMADLIAVLKDEKDWVSAEVAAQRLGIANGATSDAVEEFYRDLRDQLANGKVEVERRGDADWLRLVPEKVA